jgi:hypothetical protein
LERKKYILAKYVGATKNNTKMLVALLAGRHGMELSVSLFSVHLFTHLLAFLYSVHAVSVTETDRQREGDRELSVQHWKPCTACTVALLHGGGGEVEGKRLLDKVFLKFGDWYLIST